eukprot:479262_1
MSVDSLAFDWDYAGYLQFYLNETTRYVERWVVIKMSKLWILKEKPKSDVDYAHHKLHWTINYDNIENIIDLKTFTSIINIYNSKTDNHSFDLIYNINTLSDDTEDIHMQYSFQVENEQQKLEWISNVQKGIEYIKSTEIITNQPQTLCMSNCGEFGDPNYSNYCHECYKKPNVINSIVIDGYIRFIIQQLMPHKIIPESLNTVCLQFYNSIPCLGGCSRFEFGSAKTSNYCVNCFALLFKQLDYEGWLYHEMDNEENNWVKCWGVCTEAKIWLFKEEKEYIDPIIMIDLHETQTVKSALDVSRINSFIVGDDIHLSTDNELDKEAWIRYIGKAIVLACIEDDNAQENQYDSDV